MSAFEEEPVETKEEPAPIIDTVDETTAAGEDWGGDWGAPKTKKKGKKGAEAEPAKEEPKVEEAPAVEDPWSFGASKKDKKGKKGKLVVEETPKVRRFCLGLRDVLASHVEFCFISSLNG